MKLKLDEKGNVVLQDGKPVLIFHGEADTKVPPSESIRLAEALTTQGVAHQLLLLPAIGHTFRLNATWDDKPLPQDLGPVLMAFLRQHLAAKTASSEPPRQTE